MSTPKKKSGAKKGVKSLRAKAITPTEAKSVRGGMQDIHFVKKTDKSSAKLF